MDKVALRTEAKGLKIEGYRSMSAKALAAAIAEIKGGSTPAPVVEADNGTKSKRKSASAVKATVSKRGKPSKRKTADTLPSAPAKSKSAGAKPAAKGDKAKRPTKTHLRHLVKDGATQGDIAAEFGVSKPTAAKWFKDAGIKSKRGRRPGSTNGTVKVSKPKSAGTGRGRTSPRGTPTITKYAGNGGVRGSLAHAGIDWKAEWSGGKTGKRAAILNALRKFNGNKDKAFDSLKDDALKMFSKNSVTGEKLTKARAMSQLRWNLGRVALDFAVGTGQYKPSKKMANAIKAGLPSNGKKATAAPVKASKPKAAPKSKSKSKPARKGKGRGAGRGAKSAGTRKAVRTGRK